MQIVNVKVNAQNPVEGFFAHKCKQELMILYELMVLFVTEGVSLLAQRIYYKQIEAAQRKMSWLSD